MPEHDYSNLIIDRSHQGEESAANNRKRFSRRYHTQIQRAVDKMISDGETSIDDFNGPQEVRIPISTDQPTFQLDSSSGHRTVVAPGNDEFEVGDRIPNQDSESGGAGNGHGAGDSGEGEDDFIFILSEEEFRDFFFQDMELPDLTKKVQGESEEEVRRRAGFKTTGVHAQIDEKQTILNSKKRRIAVGGSPEVKELRQKIDALQKKGDSKTEDDIAEIKRLEEELKEAVSNRSSQDGRRIPSLENSDLIYRNYETHPVPITKAVMFCLMDVSGSMGEGEKDLAKRFMYLLAVFLNSKYAHLEIVFVRHHTVAEEVDEKTFFYDKINGGTKVSSGLKKVHEIISERFSPNEWNIYVTQAGDGDNWKEDEPHCIESLSKILPLSQYFAYIETIEGKLRRHRATTLWKTYEKIAKSHAHFQMKPVSQRADIPRVFADLFKKSEVK